jgi:hypothetical protein
MDVSRVLTCQIGWTSAPVVIHLVLVVRAELSSLALFIDELTAHLGFGGSNKHRCQSERKYTGHSDLGHFVSSKLLAV